MSIGLIPFALMLFAFFVWLGMSPALAIVVPTLIIGMGTAAILRSLQPVKITCIAITTVVAQWLTAPLVPAPPGWLAWALSPVAPMAACCLAMLLCTVMALFGMPAAETEKARR